MGMYTFSLPPNLPQEVSRDLARVSVTGGPDAMPTVGQVLVEPTQLAIARNIDESGTVLTPWLVPGAGHFIVQTATLIERTDPYTLPLELARGKINQLRNQSFDWLMAGLNIPPTLTQQTKEATLGFTRAVVGNGGGLENPEADEALKLSCAAADQLVQVYLNQVFQVRQSRQPQLDTLLGCRLGSVLPEGDAAAALIAACNCVSIPFPLHDIAPAEKAPQFDKQDALLDWAKQQGMTVWGGPLLDFSSAQIPSWLYLWEGDRGRIAKVLCDYTADVLEHYQGRIGTWQLTTASNLPGVLSLNDDELLWLTLQMGETARRYAPGTSLVIGIAQPWGDYLSEKERMYSPFVFADTLLRSGLPIAALDLEIILGMPQRGSYCRDLLDFSRLLDLYGLLGVPLQITLGYPAARAEDEQADFQVGEGAGFWRDGLNPETQAAWASAFAALALCKPSVRAVQWVHVADTEPHQFANCGLIDSAGKPRPALDQLRGLREKYLR